VSDRNSEAQKARARGNSKRWRDAHSEYNAVLAERRKKRRHELQAAGVDINAERRAKGVPEEVRARARVKAKAKYREKISSETPEQREERLSKQRVAQKRHRLKDPESHRAKCRAYRERNLSAQRERERAKAPAYTAVRRARLAGARVKERIEHLVVAERDGWICHLCGDVVTRGTWSIDHLIPLSRGGDHSYANVRLAHRLCNVRRGTAPLK
jgi:5-methylcytosine-specific restriction endonuclease McrA